MYILRKTLFVAALIVAITSGQGLDTSNEDSAVLLTLAQSKPDTSQAITSSPVVHMQDDTKSDKYINADIVHPILVTNKNFLNTSKSTASGQQLGRPSLLQSFLAGREGTLSPRLSPIATSIQNLNITGRIGKLRERIGRFRIPQLMTNEQSFAYRSGKRAGLFLQGIQKRARELAERLRARAATATPTAS